MNNPEEDHMADMPPYDPEEEFVQDHIEQLGYNPLLINDEKFGETGKNRLGELLMIIRSELTQ